jgi:nucleolar protein 56
MKCFIADTLIGIFAFDEGGNILNFIDFEGDVQKIVEFYELMDSEELKEEFKVFLLNLNNSGFDEFIFDNKRLEALTSGKLGYNTILNNSSLEFKNFRLNLEAQIKKIGLSLTQQEILKIYKEVNEELIKMDVSKAGEQTDVLIIQIIDTIELIKKSLSLFSTRLREWYGLHFPELTDKIIEDNIQLVELVKILGDRTNYTLENLEKHFEFKKKLAIQLAQRAKSSMGADFELDLVENFASQILSLDSYREELENKLEKLMETLAPNLNAVIGALIGAKLIAKAGGLKKLAYMPASRVQLLGAEKALYQFLKTGDKRPKHGLIFQWKQIRGSQYHLRGKISRLIAGKIGIASKVDFFGGEFIGDTLSDEIAEKIKDIQEKHPKPSGRKEKRPPKKRKKKSKRKGKIKK